MPEQKGLLLSDLDGTLGKRSLDMVINSQLKDGFLSSEFYQDYLDIVEKMKQTTDHEETDKLVEIGLNNWAKGLEGQKYEDIYTNTKKIVSEQMEFFDFTMPTLELLKANNYNIAIVTTQPQFVAQAAMEHLGADDYRSTVFKVDEDGKFNGEVSRLLTEKTSAVDELLEKYSPDPEKTIGLGDTLSDKPIFDVVAYPMWMNPNEDMKEHIVSDGRIKVVTQDSIGEEIVNALINSTTIKHTLNMSNNEKFLI